MSNSFASDFLKTFKESDFINKISERFNVLKCIGSNDYGETFLLSEKISGNLFVYKSCRNPEQSDINEAALLRGLEYKGIPSFESFGDNLENPNFSVRKYIDGVPLNEYLTESDYTDEHQAVNIIIKLCDILTFLHTQLIPIIHRDIKPSNIIINPENNEITLIDFGIARKYSENAESDTTYFGTHRFAPPEQFGFAQTDCRTDIYSLGVVMRYWLTGTTDRKIKIDNKQLERIAAKCTALAPEARFQSAEALKKALNHYKHRIKRRVINVTACIFTICFILIIGLIVKDYFINLYEDSPVIDNKTPVETFDNHSTESELIKNGLSENNETENQTFEQLNDEEKAENKSLESPQNEPLSDETAFDISASSETVPEETAPVELPIIKTTPAKTVPTKPTPTESPLPEQKPVETIPEQPLIETPPEQSPYIEPEDVINFTVYQTPAGYNERDYQALISFFTQNANNKAIIENLNWDLSNPATWSTGNQDPFTNRLGNVKWSNESLKRITEITFYTTDFEGELDLSGLSNLESLWISTNDISNVNLKGCAKLRVFLASENNLTNLDLSGCPNLEHISVWGNKITALDLSKNTKLMQIECQGNRLTDISSFNALPNLCFVEINGNRLDLSNQAVKDSVEAITATIEKNKQIGLSDNINSFNLGYNFNC